MGEGVSKHGPSHRGRGWLWGLGLEPALSQPAGVQPVSELDLAVVVQLVEPVVVVRGSDDVVWRNVALIGRWDVTLVTLVWRVALVIP